jgi:3-phenylpropionate/trans-cinnamate dioxygenase ferredoxin subunit
MTGWVDVAPLEELGPEQRTTVIVDGVPVVVLDVGGQLHVVADDCSHEAYPLSDGEPERDSLTCAMHGARLSLRTGEALAPPAYELIATFPVRVNRDLVQVRARNPD